MKYRIVVLFLYVFFSSGASALIGQIPAPNLYCIKGDTIRWDIPIIGCGAFISYDIYVSSSKNGPFSLLISVMNQSQKEYVRIGAPTGLQFYYLTSNANCIGMNSLSSDTLSNQTLLPPEVKVVSVSNQNVQIDWLPSTSPETAGYIIYRLEDTGTLTILDTVSSSLSFVDYFVNPSTGSYTYFVNAIDRCGTISIFTSNHSSIFLKSSIDTCKSTAQLNFNAYNGWAGGVKEYKILASINGQSEIELISSNSSNIVISNLIDRSNYKIRIMAIGHFSQEISYSNVINLKTKNEITLQDICILNVDVSSDNFISLNYDLAPQSSSNTVKIWSGNSLENILSSPILVDELASTGLVVTTRNLNQSHYLIAISDNCRNVINSNIVSTIQLKSEVKPDNSIHFSWENQIPPSATLIEYNLSRLTTTNAYELIYSGQDESYIDALTLLESHDYNCFILEAKYLLNCAGTSKNLTSVSNINCAEKSASFYMPNAFKPDGINTIFKPVFIFEESIKSYELLIYDRYGTLVFHSNEPSKGWDGTINKNLASGGAYAYKIKVDSINGNINTAEGSLILLR